MVQLKKSLTLPLMALSVLAGGVHGYLSYESSKGQKPVQKARLAQKREKKREEPQKAETSASRPQSSATTEETSSSPQHQTASLEELTFQKAKALFQKGLFARSEELLASLLEKQKGGREVELLWKKSVVFHSLIRSLPQPRQDTSPRGKITLKQGAELLATHVALSEREVSFIPLMSVSASLPEGLTAGQKVTLPREEIQEWQLLPPKRWQHLFQRVVEQHLRELTAKKNPPSFMPYYQLVYLCVQQGVFSPLANLLEHALNAKGGPLLLEAFSTHPHYSPEDLKRFWREVSRSAEPSPQMPEVTPTPPPSPQESPQPPPTTPKAQPTPSSESSSAQEGNSRPEESQPPKTKELPARWKKRLELARRELQKGMTYYRKIYTTRHPKRKQRLIQKAVEHFQKAYDTYEEILRKFPEQSELEETLSRLSMLLYDCRKMGNF